MNITTINRPRLWTSGDWNGYFGFCTNILLNVMVLTGLCLTVVNLPSDLVFARILPALGVALPLGNIFYAYMAFQLAKKEGRTDVTALPYGPSVPHMFIVIFLVMLPAYLKTNDPFIAWQAGLAWSLIIGSIVIIGAFVGPWIRKFTPKAAMLGTLAGIALTFISMRPAMGMLSVPWIGLVSLALILVSWAGNFRFPFNIPSGLMIVFVGALLGWTTSFLGDTGVSTEALKASVDHIGFFAPIFSFDAFKGLLQVSPFLATAIPLGIFNFVEAMNNVESAASAGDNYDLRKVLLADGFGAILGACFGSPFPPAVYIGHPGWKSIGGRIGYSLLSGVTVGVICFLGLVAFFLAVIPLSAILPILLYIGLLIGAQAFQSVPLKHAPAIILAFIPSLAEWGKTMVDGALSAAGTSAGVLGLDSLSQAGVLYHGLERLGAGSILSGMLLCSMAVFVIDDQVKKASVVAMIAALLSAIGMIHAHTMALLPNVDITVGYLLMAVIFAWVAYTQQKQRTV